MFGTWTPACFGRDPWASLQSRWRCWTLNMNSGGTSGPVERAERAADEKESLCCRKLHPNNIMWSLRSVPQRKAAAALCFVGWRFWSGCRMASCFCLPTGNFRIGWQSAAISSALMRRSIISQACRKRPLCRRDMAGGVSERAGQRKPGTCILQRPRPTISPFGTGTIASVDGVGREPSRTARSACFAVRTAEI